MKPIKRALISVYDKKGLVPFAKGLTDLGVKLISTGRTAEALRKAKVEVTEVSSLTGFPEMLDGRVKTLHPKIHAGILARRDLAAHMGVLKKFHIPPIDMVIVSLYPFETILRSSKRHQDKIEMIDIGGPTLLRAAAKNFQSVASVCDTEDYAWLLEELRRRKGCLTREALRRLAAKVFQRTSQYDGAIGGYLSGAVGNHDDLFSVRAQSVLPATLRFDYEKIRDLRYGENPHQRGALYRRVADRESGLAEARVLGGKELSFNNYLDLESAWTLISSFREPAACVIKHSSPCGFALGKDTADAFQRAHRCDPLSAFGGIVGLNHKVDRRAAKSILAAGFLECILAKDFDRPALELLRTKKNLRLIQMPPIKVHPALEFKKITGGLVAQDRDVRSLRADGVQTVTRRKPTSRELGDLLLGFELLRFVKSNAIVLVKGRQAVGIGTGQPSRVDSVLHALRKAGKKARGAALASDGFFPKTDAIQVAAHHGIRSIIQPGGSVADREVIKASDRAGIGMVFTGLRHFSH